LTPRERKIIEMRFGLRDGIGHTLEEVGKEFGVTRERIRQIEAKVLQKIARSPRSLTIREHGGVPKRIGFSAGPFLRSGQNLHELSYGYAGRARERWAKIESAIIVRRSTL